MAPLLILPISLAAGFVGAIGGMGGGILLIPALTFFGMEIKKAIALSIVSVIATSSGSASAYVRDRLTNLKIGMFLEVFTILGALAGASIAVSIHSRYLFFLLGTVLLGSAFVLWIQRNRDRTPSEPGAFSRWLELSGTYPERSSGRVVSYHAVRAQWAGPCMLGAGLIAGLLGIGAGALKVLVLDMVMGLPPKVATTTSNLIIGVTALAGASVYLASGWIDPGQAGLVILGVLVGSIAGTRVLVRLSNQIVRRIFLVLLVVMGIEVLVRGARGQ
jgi:uncharacterized membrane protein YfcA